MVRQIALAAALVAFLSSPAVAQDVSAGVRLSMETRFGAKIVGGQRATIGDWPALVSLRGLAGPGFGPRAAFGLHYCGGTAIAPGWILTAAHCVTTPLEGVGRSSFREFRRGGADGMFAHDRHGPIEVVFGTDDLGEEGRETVRRAAEIIVHPDYDARLVVNDLALVRLDRPWGGAVMPLSPDAASDPSGDARVFVAGFGLLTGAAGDHLQEFVRSPGATPTLAGSRFLVEVGVPQVAPDRCGAVYANHRGESQICAGFDGGGRDSCQGDSGGPLVAIDHGGEIYQIGIVSYGRECAARGSYGVYTRLSHYADWIAAHVPDAVMPSRVEEPAPAALAQAVDALIEVLEPARGRARLTINPGTDFHLGDLMTFDVTASVSGRLVVLDHHTSGEIVRIFPSRASTLSAGFLLAANRTVRFPDAGFGFVFRAAETEEAGQLIVIVVPDDFPLETTVWSEEAQAADLAPDTAPTGLVMNLIRQVLDYRRLDGLAFAVGNYTIRP